MENQSGPRSLYVVEGTSEAFTSGDAAQAYSIVQRIHNKMNGGTGRPPEVMRVRVDGVDLESAVEAVIDSATENDLQWFAKFMDVNSIETEDPYDGEDPMEDVEEE